MSDESTERIRIIEPGVSVYYCAGWLSAHPVEEIKLVETSQGHVRAAYCMKCGLRYVSIKVSSEPGRKKSP